MNEDAQPVQATEVELDETNSVLCLECEIDMETEVIEVDQDAFEQIFPGNIEHYIGSNLRLVRRTRESLDIASINGEIVGGCSDFEEAKANVVGYLEEEMKVALQEVEAIKARIQKVREYKE